MRRACEIKPAGAWNEASAVDCIALDAHERHRRRIVLTGERGTTFLLDLPRATALRDGDGLLLDDGAIVRIAGRKEPLVEITAASPSDLARLAWHVGNRHIDVQIVGDRLRIRRDHVIEDMLRGLGARVAPIEAPFEPEGGAYAHHHYDDDHF
ncbi:MAG TPA: urease accessory protein UreE [Xanthobacteraceae bacterium]|nr:urease accessory protein UreE [Xanthobacteraceae bacterium]